MTRHHHFGNDATSTPTQHRHHWHDNDMVSHLFLDSGGAYLQYKMRAGAAEAYGSGSGGNGGNGGGRGGIANPRGLPPGS